MFNDEILQTFILHTHPVQLVMLKERWMTLDDLFSYERYMKILENPSTIELLCEKWDIHLPCSKFEFFILRWNLDYLLREDIPLWYCKKYILKFILSYGNIFRAKSLIHNKRKDWYDYCINEGFFEQDYIQKDIYTDLLEMLKNEDFEHFHTSVKPWLFRGFESIICLFGYPKNLIRKDIYKKKYPEILKMFPNSASRSQMLFASIHNIHGPKMIEFLNPVDEELKSFDDEIRDMSHSYQMSVYLAKRWNWVIPYTNIFVQLLALGYDVQASENCRLTNIRIQNYSCVKICNPDAYAKIFGDFVPDFLDTSDMYKIAFMEK